MKKKLIIITAVVAFCAAIFAIAGCAVFGENADPNAGGKTFKVTYLDGNEILFERQVKENAFAENIVPEKTYYRFEHWTHRGVPYNFLPVTEDIYLTAQWRTEEYTVDFVCDGTRIAQRRYTIENKNVEIPPVIQKEGFIATWETFLLNGGNITVNAIYTAVNYKINYYTDEGLYKTLTYTVEDKNIDEPDVPAKPYYTGVWEEYQLGASDIDVHATYSPVDYFIDFYVDGVIVGTRKYNVENMLIVEPDIPEKEHYAKKWHDYKLPFPEGTGEVHAVYTPIEYAVLFTDGNGFEERRTYNVENMILEEPQVPLKAHYEGKWSPYELDFRETVSVAVYTPIKYTVEFYADGKLYAERFYDIENRHISEPDVPVKNGYNAEWSYYRLNLENVRVDAIYTEIPEPETTKELIFVPSEDGQSYSVAGVNENFKGTAVVIPSHYNNLPVRKIAESAFARNENIKEITIFNGVTVIEKYAFQSCTELKTINFPDTLNEIGAMAFYACGITELVLPQSLEIIGERAFQLCTEFTSLDIPDFVTEIASRTFAQCARLKTVTIGSKVRMLGVNVFNGCPLESVTFTAPDNWRQMDELVAPEYSVEVKGEFDDPVTAADKLLRHHDYYYVKSEE